MTRFTILFAFLLLCLSASPAFSGTRTFAVGEEATFVNVFTRESRVRGFRIGRVRVDLAKVEARCRRLDAGFEGFVRIEPVARGGSEVKIQCLHRAATAVRTDVAREKDGA